MIGYVLMAVEMLWFDWFLLCTKKKREKTERKEKNRAVRENNSIYFLSLNEFDCKDCLYNRFGSSAELSPI